LSPSGSLKLILAYYSVDSENTPIELKGNIVSNLRIVNGIETGEQAWENGGVEDDQGP